MSVTPLPLPIKLVKYTFIFFNILFVLCGICLIGVGAWLVDKDPQSLSFLFGSGVVGGGVVLILCGLATFIIAGVGVAGAFLQWRPLLVAFGATLAVIVFVEIVVAIVGFAFRGNLESTFTEAFLAAMNKVTTDQAAAEGVYGLQNSLMCCGASGPDDWANTPFAANNKTLLPDSCCNVTATTMPPCLVGEPNVRMQGCVAAAEATISNNIQLAVGLGLAGLLIALVEITGVALSFGLCFCIHRYKLQVV